MSTRLSPVLWCLAACAAPTGPPGPAGQVEPSSTPSSTPSVPVVVAHADDAPAWVAQDELVSDPTAAVHDPEFDLVTHHVVVGTARDELWVGSYDLVTGELDPPDARGTLIDTDIASWDLVTNGPEWAQAPTGGVVVYAKLLGASYRVMRAWNNRGVWRTAPVEGLPDGVGPIGSEEAWDDDPRVLYLDETTDQLRWDHIDGRSGGVIGPALGIAPRFVRGHPGVVWAAEVDGVDQVHWLDQDTGVVEVLTTDPARKVNPWMWLAPEYGELLFFAARGDAEGLPVALDVYRRVSDRWQVIKSIVPPASHPYVLSPEPFVSGGRSLVVFQASVRPDVLVAPSEIWVGVATPEGDELRRVDDGLHRPIDPEWAEIAGEARVYYSDFETDEPRTIRLCATGL